MNTFFQENAIWTDYNPIFSTDGEKINYINLEVTQEYFQELSRNRFNQTYLKQTIPNYIKKTNYDQVLNILGVIYLRASEYNSVSKKSYYKFIELIADTQGILGIILIIFFVLVTSVNEFKATENLVTKTMKFKGNLEDQDNVDFETFYKVFKKANRKKSWFGSKTQYNYSEQRNESQIHNNQNNHKVSGERLNDKDRKSVV